MTRVVTYLLGRAKIDHLVFIGMLTFDGKRVVHPHWWVDLPDGRRIDYRARMWAGDRPEVPHGLFLPKDFPRTGYFGNSTAVRVSAFVYEVLAGSLNTASR